MCPLQELGLLTVMERLSDLVDVYNYFKRGSYENESTKHSSEGADDITRDNVHNFCTGRVRLAILFSHECSAAPRQVTIFGGFLQMT